MAIATLIVTALAIANSISPFSAFFSDKSPAQSFEKLSLQLMRRTQQLSVNFKEFPSKPKT